MMYSTSPPILQYCRPLSGELNVSRASRECCCRSSYASSLPTSLVSSRLPVSRALSLTALWSSARRSLEDAMNSFSIRVGSSTARVNSSSSGNLRLTPRGAWWWGEEEEPDNRRARGPAWILVGASVTTSLTALAVLSGMPISSLYASMMFSVASTARFELSVHESAAGQSKFAKRLQTLDSSDVLF